jgi:serine/threonine protein kinase
MKYIGKYKIRGLLGRGGMGRIYKVEHPLIGKIFALKMLRPHPLLLNLMGREKIVDMFKAEAVTMAGLRHPNIIEILDYDESGGNPFYLMEYYVNNLGDMIGETYRTDQPSRKIRIEKVVHYAAQTLSGLDCLHHAGIIHRDIKPYNLLVTDQDTIKICDFGLSKIRGEKFSGPPNLKVGSAWYAPPEQEEAPDSVDFSSDLYAAGVTIYRMLTGILPSGDYLPVGRFNSDLDDAWDDFLAKATAPNPVHRYVTAAQMLADLQQLETAWLEKKEQICRLPEPDKTAGAGPVTMRVRPRSQCIKVDPRNARQTFGLDDLWRPARYLNNAFVLSRDETVTDRATGLVWQQAGSKLPVNRPQAVAYIEQLNASNFTGSRAWRLPTVEELMTLLTELPQGEDLCIEPIFEPTQKWIWSCDRRSFTAGWYLSVDLGYVAWQDFTGYRYVRAVRTGRQSR